MMKMSVTMTKQEIKPIQSLAEAREIEDDWTAVEVRRERKRIQNRLNQRARRRRTTEQSTEKPLKRSYRIDRWRVNHLVAPTVQSRKGTESPVSDSVLSPEDVDESLIQFQNHSTWDISPQNLSQDFHEDSCFKTVSLSPSLSFSSTPSSPDSVMPFHPPTYNFPLSSDHLIHLIHFNVFRGLTTNKTLLNTTTSLLKPTIFLPIIPSTIDLCDGLSVILPLDDDFPPTALQPTTLQMTLPHPSWMNMFPCPAFRDNILTQSDTFKSADMLYDVFGDLIANTPKTPYESESNDVEFEDDDMTARRRGLIVWGDPWKVESWEVTPGFLRKWGQLLNGCEDLISASNRWRAMRDEDPLPSVVVEMQWLNPNHK